MVRTVKSHQEVDEIDDEEFTSATPYVSAQQVAVKLEGKNNNQKANALRSKHSETEQRRRSKINERFQVLRDLIPENDQKRDKASFLLEVIQYIQFLQEKIQMYEGTYQGWSSESSKLMPWQRSNSGPVESFVDQPQFLKNGSSHEDNIVVASTLLSSSQNSIESDLNGAALYRPTDHPQVAGNLEIPLNVPVQANLFEVVSAHPPQGSFSDPNHLTPDSRSQFWSDRRCSSECVVPVYYPNQEQLRTEDEEADISSVYSQGLLNTLTHALQSSGVDLSRANISVQLDIGKQTNGRSTASLIMKDFSSIQPIASYSNIIQNDDHVSKKLKASKS